MSDEQRVMSEQGIIEIDAADLAEMQRVIDEHVISRDRG